MGMGRLRSKEENKNRARTESSFSAQRSGIPLKVVPSRLQRGIIKSSVDVLSALQRVTVRTREQNVAYTTYETVP